jgi:6-phosphogluconolactonase
MQTRRTSRWLRVSVCVAGVLVAGQALSACSHRTPPHVATAVGSDHYVLYVAGYDATIRVLRFDAGSGTVTPASTADGGVNPSYLAWNAAGTRVYAVNEAPGERARVVAFAIDGATGALARLGDHATGGDGPTHIAVHPSGRWVLTANYGGGSVSVLPVDADGNVTERTQVEPAGKNAHMVAFDATGTFAFVPCKGADAVAQYRFVDGQLVANAPAVARPASPDGSGPRHLALHPARHAAYLVNELAQTITSFAYDASAGTLGQPQDLPLLPEGLSGGTAAHVVVHPSGAFVYASTRIVGDAIDVFSVRADGRLAPAGRETGGGAISVPRDFTVDPTGRFLIVANQKANDVLVFAIDPRTGALTRTGTRIEAKAPSFVGVLRLPG